MPPLLSVITFLALVPVTLLVPGLDELVSVRLGGSAADAHAFMTVNMLAGVVGVAVMMRLMRRYPDARRWLVALLTVDAIAFLGMLLADSLPVLFAWRAVDGAVHLPAITALMVGANRSAGSRRGGSMGALASALMLGVTVGSPLGGWLITRGAEWVYGVGASLFVIAAMVSLVLPPLPKVASSSGARGYHWNRRTPETWIPLAYAFMDRFSIGVFVSTFTIFLARVHAFSATSRGLLVALFMLPFAALSYPAGRLAERRGWFGPMVAGNILFGLVYASYGLVPRGAMPLAMLLSGLASALMFSPSLLLVADLVKRGAGEGLFGAFQVSGSLGFLAGPIAGGILVATTSRASATGTPAYEAIFAGVGALEFGLAALSFVFLRRVAREMRAAPEAIPLHGTIP